MGIYILQFAAGDRYVGQAVNVAKRISQHRHGGKHHPGWTDIVAVAWQEVPTRSDLNAREREVIADQQAQGFALRNVVHNFHTTAVRPIDAVLNLSTNSHWATGQEQYLYSGEIALPKRRTDQIPRLLLMKSAQERLPDGRTVADAVIDDLAFAVSRLIPNAPELEGEYWSISDYPATSGGRFATLNVGNLEVMYHPRARTDIDLRDDNRLELVCCLNLPADDDTRPDPTQRLLGVDESILPDYHFELWDAIYPLTRTLRLSHPIGVFHQLTGISRDEVTGSGQSLTLSLMRRGRNTLFNRYHSVALADCVYDRIRSYCD